jgi:hypothetical protein
MRLTQCHTGNHRMYRIRGADGREYGPATAEQMRQWLAENRVNANTLVQVEGSASWQPLSSRPELAGEVTGSAPAPLTAGAPALFVPGPSAPRLNPMALTGMIMGILSMVALCGCYGFPFNILGFVFSIIGLFQINHSPETYTGRGLALTGLSLSILSVVILIVLIAVFGVYFFAEMKKEMHH